MKAALFFFIGFFIPLLTSAMDGTEPVFNTSANFDPSTVLWYKQPAKIWEDALPVGNGRIGAMVFGNYGDETIQLNEETYWSGGPYSSVQKGGYKMLPEIQRLVFNGEPIKAHKLFGRYLMGYPVEQQKYQAMANLHLSFGHERVTDYTRSLDLKTGVITVRYKSGGVKYMREIFASAVDQTIAIRITADRPASISFDAELRGVRNSAHSNYATDYFRMETLGADQLRLTGRSADYLGIAGRVRYDARIKVNPEGGTMKQDDETNTTLMVRNSDAVTLYFVAATNFVNYKDVSANQLDRVEKMVAGLNNKSYSEIKTKALNDYKYYFDRVRLTLPEQSNSSLPTNIRMERIQKSPDPQLATLCYNFGRYLLISSSRPGTQPANLQGIWNNDMNPAWDAKYTTNINLEMNYWAVESANLSELAEPLIKLVKELTDEGTQVAREHYGAKGWVFHQNTDIWRVAAPMDGPTWGTFTVGGAWLTTHLWEHFLYNQDSAFLREVYPVIKGAVDFFMDFLVPYPGKDWLVTNPSNSPENPPKAKGYRYFYDEVTSMYYFTTIVAGATMDMQILKDLFNYYISATEILDIDHDYAKTVSRVRDRFPPSQIGNDGMLQEWTEDYEQLEDKHRHFSHLYGLYPGNVISLNKTPEFIEPVKRVLEQRGDGGTGFSHAWKMALWARLADGNRANKIFKNYLKDQCFASLFAKCGKPFQIDGTLGVTAAITEMLIQSNEGYVELLPALPIEWESGEFKGVCARGGFELDFKWKNSNVNSLMILSKAGMPFRIKTEKKIRVFQDKRPVQIKNHGNGITEFETTKGTTYSIQGL